MRGGRGWGGAVRHLGMPAQPALHPSLVCGGSAVCVLVSLYLVEALLACCVTLLDVMDVEVKLALTLCVCKHTHTPPALCLAWTQLHRTGT